MTLTPAPAMLDRAEELRLARAARSGDQGAFDRLVRAHLPLAHAIAWRYRSYGLPLEDLTSEALLGLVKGVRCFDAERGVRLAAYAALWMRAYVRRYTLDNRRLVRGPSTRNTRRVLANLRRVERELTRELGEAPDAEQVARALGVTTRDVEDIRLVLGARDLPCGVEVAGRRVDPASHDPSPETLAVRAGERDLARDLVQNALARLDGPLRDVIVQRCLDPQPRSLAELGQQLGVSHETVRQMEVRARLKMRRTITATMFARGMRAADLCRAPSTATRPSNAASPP